MRSSAPSSRQSLVDAQRRMAYLDAAFKGWRAINITESSIDAYVAKRKTEKVPGTERLVAPATINRELAQLRRMLAPQAGPRAGGHDAA